MKIWILSALALAACSGPGTNEDPDSTTGGSSGTDSDGDSADAEACGVDAEVGLDVGQCAPEFTMPDANDVPFTLSSMRGKVALVDISAVW